MGTHKISSNLTLIGSSICAKETGFILKEKKISLDCGFYAISDLSIDYIFITHEHYDHVANLMRLLYKIKDTDRTKKELVIVVHNSIEQYIKNKISSEFDRPPRISKIHKKYKIVPVMYGEKYLLDFKTNSIEKLTDNNIVNNKWIIDIIYCHHNVPCIGFGFSECRSYLNPLYVNKTGLELKELKKTVNISLTKIVPLFCYLGDTTDIIFNNSIDKAKQNNKNTIVKYPIIITECSFITDEHKKDAMTRKHMHWSKLYPIIKQHNDTQFILIHFSQRYEPWNNTSENQIVKLLGEYTKKNNIILWTPYFFNKFNKN